MLGDLIAHSVDGDFIPIALMEYEKQVNTLLTAHGGEGKKRQRQPANIAIFRIEYRMPSARTAEAAASSSATGRAKKRDSGGKPVTLSASGGKIHVTGPHGERVNVADGNQGAASSSQAAVVVAVAKPARPARKMEYLNVPMLFHTLQAAMLQCVPTRCLDGSKACGGGYYMRVIAALIALTGTDFTR
jgi:hypothetical protein